MIYRLSHTAILNALRVCAFGTLVALAGCGGYFEPSDTQITGASAQQSANTRGVAPIDADVSVSYEAQCLTCHGEGADYPDSQLIQEQWGTVETLAAAIESHPTLADGTTLDCVGECAQAFADHMINALKLPILYVNQGQDFYDQQCAACHGAQGEGGSGGALTVDVCRSCDSLETLIQRTTDTMPPQNIGLCVGTCAVETSRYIKANFVEVSADGTPDGDIPPADNPGDTPVVPDPDPNTGTDPVNPGDNPPDPNNPGDVPGVDPGVGGTLTCDEAGKATVFAETVYPNVLAPKCGLCHGSAIANGSLFMMQNDAAVDYPLFVQAADPMYDVNGEPLLLMRAVNDGGGHTGGRVFLRGSVDFTAVATMIQVLPAEGDACEVPFRSLYEAFGLPFPGML